MSEAELCLQYNLKDLKFTWQINALKSSWGGSAISKMTT